jgi:predicted nuclease of predicted toxin-antitoxin system
VARFYADEQFPLKVSEFLRTLGHDVLTVQEAGNAGLGIPDPEVLAFAVSNERAVLTLNRFDFIRLHRLEPDHAGIIVCTEDRNLERLATRINEAISPEETLRGKLIRVHRPSR